MLAADPVFFCILHSSGSFIKLSFQKKCLSVQGLYNLRNLLFFFLYKCQIYIISKNCPLCKMADSRLESPCRVCYDIGTQRSIPLLLLSEGSRQ